MEEHIVCKGSKDQAGKTAPEYCRQCEIVDRDGPQEKQRNAQSRDIPIPTTENTHKARKLHSQLLREVFLEDVAAGHVSSKKEMEFVN